MFSVMFFEDVIALRPECLRARTELTTMHTGGAQMRLGFHSPPMRSPRLNVLSLRRSTTRPQAISRTRLSKPSTFRAGFWIGVALPFIILIFLASLHGHVRSPRCAIAQER